MENLRPQNNRLVIACFGFINKIHRRSSNTNAEKLNKRAGITDLVQSTQMFISYSNTIRTWDSLNAQLPIKMAREKF